MGRRRRDGSHAGVRRVPERDDKRKIVLPGAGRVAPQHCVRQLAPLLGRMLLLCLPLFVAGALSGCSAPKRAAVVSLEQPAGKKRVVNRSRYQYHRVRRGDTLYTIAWRYGVDYPDLARWNSIGYPYTIYPGQRLRLSDVADAAASGVLRPTVRQKRAADSSATRSAKSGGAPGKRPSPGAHRTEAGKVATTPRSLLWSWPAKGQVLQRYAKGDPARKGIKIGGRLGQRVAAAESGKVVYAGSGLIGYGRLIIIKHNKNYLSAYGYNRRLLVAEGDVVKRGQSVAEMGEQGGGRPKLHFEIRRNGTPVDPLTLLPRRR